MFQRYFKTNTWIVLGIIIVIEFIFNLLIQRYALSENFLYNSLINEMTIEEIDRVTKVTQSYSWGVFVWPLLNVLSKIFLISICIAIGTLLLRYDIRFQEIFATVTKAFAIFAISRLLLMGSYLYFGVNQLTDLDYISNLSLYAMLKNQPLPDWAIIPLQAINVFQVVFILLLAIGLNFLQYHGLKRWIPFVLSTYGTGLAVSIILFTFLAIL